MSSISKSVGAYGAEAFVRSFEAHGEVVELPNSGLSLIRRPIEGGYYDLTGVYPFSMCPKWSELPKDLPHIKELDAVSIVLITDPFCEVDARNALENWAHCSRYKNHYTINFHDDWRQQLGGKVRGICKQSLAAHDVNIVEPNQDWGIKFWRLHQHLVEKHKISGMGNMTLSMLQQQLMAPGTLISTAENNGDLLGAMILMVNDDKCFWYLAATDARAYKAKTNYALIYNTLIHLEGLGIKWINLGGNAGEQDDESNGLSRFKNKWANEERYSLLCGDIINPKIYKQLSHSVKQDRENPYFPAYRR